MGEKLFFKKVFHHHKASFAQQNEPNTTSFAQQNEPNPKQVLRSKTSSTKKASPKTDLLFCAVIQKN